MVDPLHQYIRMHILQTVLYAIPWMLTRIIRKSILSWGLISLLS